MKLPLFIRRIVASWKALRSDEFGGLLINWKNGQFEVIAEWKTDDELDAAWQLVESHLDSGRDEIYIALVKQAPGSGYMVIHAPGGFILPYAFWDGWVSVEEAFIAVRDRCREIGTKMGYRAPEETKDA
jgi:hypothetical protein